MYETYLISRHGSEYRVLHDSTEWWVNVYFSREYDGSFKTLLPQTMDFTDSEWEEVGLTEMMYPNTLQNIDPREAHFDILIPTHLDVEPEDPDIAGRFTIEKIGR